MKESRGLEYIGHFRGCCGCYAEVLEEGWDLPLFAYRIPAVGGMVSAKVIGRGKASVKKTEVVYRRRRQKFTNRVQDKEDGTMANRPT